MDTSQNGAKVTPKTRTNSHPHSQTQELSSSPENVEYNQTKQMTNMKWNTQMQDMNVHFVIAYSCFCKATAASKANDNV